MNHRRSLLLAAAAVSGAAAAASSVPGAALAQAPGTAAGVPGALTAGQVRAKTLMDRDVYSSDGVEIGEIEDLILDAQGRVVSVVIELEGRLGFTEKHVAVPYDQLRPDNAQRRVNLPMTRDQLRAMPGFRYQD